MRRVIPRPVPGASREGGRAVTGRGRRWLGTAALAAAVLGGCASSNEAPLPSKVPAPDTMDMPADAVGTLSAKWLAGGGGPVEVTEEWATWGLASSDESWDGAEIGIKRARVAGVVNGDVTTFFDASGTEIPDASDDLEEGANVRVWCDFVAQSLPPICSVSHVQLLDS